MLTLGHREPNDEPDQMWFLRSGHARLEGIVDLGQGHWAVTGFIPYEGIVVLARFQSCEKATTALSEAVANAQTQGKGLGAAQGSDKKPPAGGAGIKDSSGSRMLAISGG